LATPRRLSPFSALQNISTVTPTQGDEDRSAIVQSPRKLQKTTLKSSAKIDAKPLFCVFFLIFINFDIDGYLSLSSINKQHRLG